MTIRIPSTTTASNRKDQAWSLLAVLTMTSVSLVYLAGVMNWSNASATTMQRSNLFAGASYAAEAATEKVIASMLDDAIAYGEGYVYNRLQGSSTYSNIIPTSSDSSYLTGFHYSGGSGMDNKVLINLVNASNTIVLGPPYANLYCYGDLYEVIANAYSSSDPNRVTAAVGQQLDLGQIPVFQFAIFYEYEMEIAPGPVMTISGPVHGNSIIYLDPASTLTFSNTLSATSNIVLTADPNDPGGNKTPATINFLGGTNVPAPKLELPIGTNDNGAGGENIYATLQVPPSGESPSSSVGTNRYYNKADMIILISNNTSVSITSGVAVNDQATAITNWQLFLNLTNQFYSGREDATVQAATLDENKLRLWSATNTTLYTALGNRNVESVYIADLRPTSNSIITTNTILTLGTNITQVPNTKSSCSPSAGTYTNTITMNTSNVVSSSTGPSGGSCAGGASGTVTTTGHGGSTRYTYTEITGYTYTALVTTIITTTNYTYLTNWTVFAEPGILLTNGATLPPGGLTITTPDPAYIAGNWNVSTNGSTLYTNTSSTANSLPSSICADAITILSPAWNPNHSSNSLSSRVAVSDTVNAAFLTGYVPTVTNSYSGGVENFPRFQEDWSSSTFYYNGSLVAMFYSQIANHQWPGTGSVYNAPTRIWSFDQNFNNPAKMPPLTPSVQYYSRQGWTVLNPNTTRF